MNTQETTKDYPLVTVGITAYNNVRTHCDDEGVLRRGLDCFVNQDYPNLEIIIQDDCSSDNTYNVCREYAQKYAFIKLYKNEKNLGVESNITQLTHRVNGEFFLWGCVDDVYEKDYISNCTRTLMTEPTKSVCQSYIKTIYQDKEVIDYYENIDPPLTNEKTQELNQILFYRESYTGKYSSPNPLIHGVIRKKYLSLIFGLPDLLYYELAIPIVLIWGGGVCVVKETLFINEAKRLFKERYPESSFVKQASSHGFVFLCGFKILFYFLKLYLRGDLKVSLGVVLKTWANLFNFYFLKRFLADLKATIFQLVDKYFPPLISLYRFFKRHFQN